MPADLTPLLDDLAAETADLDAILAPLTDEQWRLATPAQGWSIADQVSHLAHFDEAALLAATDPDRFRREAAELVKGGFDFPDRVAAAHRHREGSDLLAWFRTARHDMLTGFAEVDPEVRLPWYGPDMAPASSLTARLMETWAHGQDVVDALGVQRPATPRLKHIAHLGTRTFGFVFGLHGRPVPETPVRVELDAPDGSTWQWGPDDAVDRVTGPALDFCLLVTQRRHRVDLALTAVGETATEWLTIAQAFAGAPGPGRPPLRDTAS
ncbi:MAG: TIGR03084 family metal-binding protein [Rhodococcus sp. (in: high G+C Gram-positive bacteria)]|uniref:TIGR03084 family metal-binding protein n=1 Tax=Rhodococcus sp. TaxID=1831 RepID=UPI003BAF0584